MTELRDWAGLPEETWHAVSARLGTVTATRVLAYMPADSLRDGVTAARVPTPAQGNAGDPGHVPAGVRALTPVEVTQVGLMRQGAQVLTGQPPEDPWRPPPPAGGGGGAPAGTGQPGTPKRKVKCSHVLDQTDEAEVPELPQNEVDRYYDRLTEVKGGTVRPEAEPTPDQISALKVRVLDLGLSPYADFGIFVNFQRRFSKTLKFLNHVLQPDGTFKAVEVPGPPNYDVWLSSWRVFENVLLMFTQVVGGDTKAIVTPAALEEYKDSFRDLVVSYPEAWHLCVVAEDRCRSEHFPRLRRELTAKHGRGLTDGFSPDLPWSGVFREAARDRGY